MGLRWWQPLAGLQRHGKACLYLIQCLTQCVQAQPALKQALQDIAQESERAARVIGSVRALARKRVPERVRIDPQALAQQAMGLQGCGQHLDVRLVCAPGTEQLRVLGDAPQLLQVLLNLLQNARDVHRQCGCEDRAIALEIATEDGQLALAVRDYGQPLSAQEQQLLFTPFHTTKRDGLGLGLSISRSIAEAHGGALHARPVPSAEGGGMRMVLLLPLADAASHLPEQAPHTSSVTTFPPGA